MCLFNWLLLFYLQVIRNVEDVRHAVSANVNYIFVELVGYHAFQRYIAVFYYDVDGRKCAISIPIAERWIAIDGSRFGPSDLVVHGR